MGKVDTHKLAIDGKEPSNLRGDPITNDRYFSKEFMTKEECDKFGMTWDDKTTCFDKHNKTEKGKNELITYDPYKVIYIPDRDYDMVKTNDSYCTCKEYEKSNCGKDIKPICH